LLFLLVLTYWGGVPQFDIILKAHDLLHASSHMTQPDARHMTQLDANPDSAPEKGETAFCNYATPGGDQCIKETSVILIRDNNNLNTKKLGDLSAKQLSCIAVLTPNGKIDGEKPEPLPNPAVPTGRRTRTGYAGACIERRLRAARGSRSLMCANGMQGARSASDG
jgi:hypothetical protein